MIKQLLTLSIAAATAMSVSATFTTTNTFGRSSSILDKQLPTVQSLVRNTKEARKTLRTRAADVKEMSWGYCNDPYNAFPFDGDIKVAVMMTAETNKLFEGNNISAITVYNPVDVENSNQQTGEFVNNVKEATVWISETLDGTPICSATGELGNDGFGWSTIKLDEPFELKGDKNLYIGVSYSIPEGTYGYITDYTKPINEYSAYVYSKFDKINNQGYFDFKNSAEWKALGNLFGNACLRCVIEGDNLPRNYVDLESYEVPTTVIPEKPFGTQMIIINSASNAIEKVELTMEIEGMAPQTAECEIGLDYNKQGQLIYGSLEYNNYGLIMADFQCDVIGNNIPWRIYISKINGEATNNGNFDMKGTLLCLKEGFAKNNVIEEATGTWCGWCVVGYAGMEYIKKNIPSFIGIAMHSGDRMEVMNQGNAYAPFASYIKGYPCSFLNRNWSSDIYPSPDGLAELYEEIHDIPAVAKISATLKNNDQAGKNVKLSTSYEFAISEEKADYGIAYTVVEDDLGPYRQTNYPSGMDGNYYGFENEPDPVSLLFNEVARNCSHPLPFEESILKSTTAGNEYTFETDIELSDVSNVNKYRVVAMVINNFNGAIENACVVESPTYTGIESIVSESKSAPIAFGGKGCLTVVATGLDNAIYTADGKCVASGIKSGKVNLAPGLYIVSNGRESVKTVVR